MRQYGEDIAAPVGNQPANSECQHDPNLLWSPSTRPVNQQYQGGAECPILKASFRWLLVSAGHIR